MKLIKWRIMDPEESKKLKTTVAITCPHCEATIKLGAEFMQMYLDTGAKIMQFRCPDPECLSNQPFADDFDRAFIDLEKGKVRIMEDK
jgi:hypothetical protein